MVQHRLVAIFWLFFYSCLSPKLSDCKLSLLLGDLYFNTKVYLIILFWNKEAKKIVRNRSKAVLFSNYSGQLAQIPPTKTVSESFCLVKGVQIFSNFFCMFLNPKNLFDMRNLQEQVKKAFCYQKLGSNLSLFEKIVLVISKNLKILGLQASNFKSFSRSVEQFFSL